MKSGTRNKLYIALIVIFVLMIIEGIRIMVPLFGGLHFSTTQWAIGLSYFIVLMIILGLICKFSMKPGQAKEVEIKTKKRTIKVKYKPGLMERFSNFCDKNFYK